MCNKNEDQKVLFLILLILVSTMSFCVVTIVTGLVIGISIFLEYFFSIFQIIKKKPYLPTGAIEIDLDEHIYAHPKCVDKLQDHREYGVTTVYEAILHGLKIGGDRPHFSFRSSSTESFKSYSHK